MINGAEKDRRKEKKRSIKKERKNDGVKKRRVERERVGERAWFPLAVRTDRWPRERD